ncbi:MAG: hypothetical protein HY436_00140 [Candidatus Liptonbacteria bacterium]|nr:hypothetical protein [Candidatus Liptonbacteria bacterium]
MSTFLLLLFLVTAGVNAAAQLLLKRGSLDLPGILAETPNWTFRIVKILANPFVLGAVVLLGAGMFVWIWLISKVELSRAYPINIALTILIAFFASVPLFHESLTALKLAGAGLILAGLWLMLAYT